MSGHSLPSQYWATPLTPFSRTKALHMGSPHSYWQGCSNMFWNFASSDLPTHMVSQLYSTRPDTCNETAPWYLRHFTSFHLRWYFTASRDVPRATAHMKCPSSSNLRVPHNLGRKCKSVTVDGWVWTLKNQVAQRSGCVSTSDALRDQTGSTNKWQQVVGRDGAWGIGKCALTEGIRSKMSLTCCVRPIALDALVRE